MVGKLLGSAVGNEPLPNPLGPELTNALGKSLGLLLVPGEAGNVGAPLPELGDRLGYCDGELEPTARIDGEAVSPVSTSPLAPEEGTAVRCTTDAEFVAILLGPVEGRNVGVRVPEFGDKLG